MANDARDKHTRRHSPKTMRKGIPIRTGREYKFVVDNKPLSIQCLDVDSREPRAGLECSLILPDGAVRHVVLDAQGRARIANLPPGTCRFVLGKAQAAAVGDPSEV